MRRPPKQKRSREMVSRLLDATAATITARGFENTTTNHIAEQAGVSIGSLYQYFPDKEALVEALLERVARDIGNNFRDKAAAIDFTQFALRDVVTAAIRFGMAMIRTDPLIRELVRNWNHLPVNKVLDPVGHIFLVQAQPYFLKNYRDYPVHNLEAKLYVLVNSVMFTSIRYLVEEPAAIREKEFVRTLVDMIVALLEAPARPAR